MNAGYTTPKPLLEVDGYPMVKHVVDLFPNESNITFICNDLHLRSTNMLEILNEIAPKCKIRQVPIGSKRGPVDVVMSIQDEISDDEEVIVSYCDYGTVWDYEKFLKRARKLDVDGSIPYYTGFHPHMLGTDHYAYVKNVDKIALEIKEKEPFTNNKMEECASNGTYYFKNGAILKKYFKKLIDSNQTINNEFYVSMVYNNMIEDGLKINIFEIEKMLQWGTPYDFRIYKQWMEYFENYNKKPITDLKAPKNTTLLLPMAGKGSRFLEEKYNNPKPFLKIDGHPMFFRAIKDLPQCDTVALGVLKEHVEKSSYREKILENFSDAEIVEIGKVTQGQACTVELMIEQLKIDVEDPIMVSACDNGMYYDQDKFRDELENIENDVVVCSFRNHETSKNNPNMYAWLDVDDMGFIKHVSCKNFIYDNPLKTHAIIGTMFFRKAKYFLDGLKENYLQNIRTNGEFYVDDVINQNIKKGLKVKVFEAENYICWGTPNDYKTYNYWKEHYDQNIKG
jgi:bifunctional N-acetylglucosamine-1-phosphate-uridyltransferase/glucosamine-1-phosphate-acetyltransferase GlmU-like protein